MNDSTRGRFRTLRLDSNHGWIGGVCAGLAHHLATDPAFVRTAVVLAALFFPTVVVVAYVAAWVLLDE